MPSYKDQMYGYYYNEMALAHHGVKGQKWGVRRYQNEDGTRTAAGRRHEQANNLDSYGTLIGSGKQIRANYKKAKRSAFERSAKRSDRIDSETDSKLVKNEALRKSGKITNRQAKKNADKIIDEAGKKYDAENRRYKSEKQAAKAQYHENRARMLENRANQSTAATNDNILLRGLNNDRMGRANTERLKANVSMAKASGDKKAISQAKKALNRSNALNFTFGRANVAAYNKYKNSGESTVKALLKAGTIG